MPDTKFSVQASARLSGLKTALLDELRVLELDAHTARARTEALLAEALCETLPVSEPII